MALFLVKIKTNDCLFQKRGHAEPRWLQQLPTSCCPPVKSLWIPPILREQGLLRWPSADHRHSLSISATHDGLPCGFLAMS